MYEILRIQSRPGFWPSLTLRLPNWCAAWQFFFENCYLSFICIHNGASSKEEKAEKRWSRITVIYVSKLTGSWRWSCPQSWSTHGALVSCRLAFLPYSTDPPSEEVSSDNKFQHTQSTVTSGPDMHILSLDTKEVLGLSSYSKVVSCNSFNILLLKLAITFILLFIITVRGGSSGKGSIKLFFSREEPLSTWSTLHEALTQAKASRPWGLDRWDNESWLAHEQDHCNRSNSGKSVGWNLESTSKWIY